MKGLPTHPTYGHDVIVLIENDFIFQSHWKINKNSMLSSKASLLTSYKIRTRMIKKPVSNIMMWYTNVLS